jgi:hypothetical protein
MLDSAKISVKVYNFGDSKTVIEKFNCSEAQAMKALEYTFDISQREFWDYWTDSDNLKDYFPTRLINGKPMVHVSQEGRSGGWMIVDGISEEDNDFQDFKKDVMEDIKWRCSEECILDAIEANCWWEESAEEYNFITDRWERSYSVSSLKVMATI